MYIKSQSLLNKKQKSLKYTYWQKHALTNHICYLILFYLAFCKKGSNSNFKIFQI